LSTLIFDFTVLVYLFTFNLWLYTLLLLHFVSFNVMSFLVVRLILRHPISQWSKGHSWWGVRTCCIFWKCYRIKSIWPRNLSSWFALKNLLAPWLLMNRRIFKSQWTSLRSCGRVWCFSLELIFWAIAFYLDYWSINYRSNFCLLSYWVSLIVEVLLFVCWMINYRESARALRSCCRNSLSAQASFNS